METGSFWSSHVWVTGAAPKSSNKTRVEEEVIHFSSRDDPVEVKEFSLDVTGPFCTTWKVTILPFSTVSVHINNSVNEHCMWVHMLMEPTPGPQLPAAVVPTVTYGELHWGPLVYLSVCTIWAPVP